MSKKSHSEITKFIKHDLPLKIQKDLLNHKIVKEADIECSTYFHLRRFIGEGTDWRILARKHAPATGHYIDLLLFNGHHPAIAIELKWAKKNIGEKDRRSLQRALEELKVQKAYWISATMDEHKALTEREYTDRHKLFQITIPLGLGKDEKKEWLSKRKKFRNDMETGKRKVVQ